MPEFFADPNTLHPVVLPDGTPHTGTVFLKPALSHPRIEVGDYSYASAHHPPEDWAACLAPYLYPFSPERLIIGKFCQIASGVQIITSSANHRHDGISTFPFMIFGGGNPAGRPSMPAPGPDTTIGHDVWIGSGATILPGARIGNFVEVKNATFGKGAKANHLAYVGDAEVGAGSNIGAGVITANYDGVFKYPSRMGENAFVGSNTTLIAPVDIGAGAYIAGGSVITGAVEEGALALSRAEKQEKPGLGARLVAKLRQMKAAGQKKKGAI